MLIFVQQVNVENNFFFHKKNRFQILQNKCLILHNEFLILENVHEKNFLILKIGFLKIYFLIFF